MGKAKLFFKIKKFWNYLEYFTLMASLLQQNIENSLQSN